MLSNTLWTREHHEQVFRRDGVLGLIDGAVYSSEIPWTKPHPEAFQAALSAVGVADPARAVFVGDRPFDDIHGAKQVGMRAVLVPHSAIPDAQKGHVEGDPDAVVDAARRPARRRRRVAALSRCPVCTRCCCSARLRPSPAGWTRSPAAAG